jgi:hypothetical protein
MTLVTASTRANATRLLVEMRMRVAQRVRGNFDQAVERPVHLQYEKYGPADRQCADEEGHEDRGVPRGEQPEARERDRQPKQENYKKRQRD